jgi:hypothetical protein
MDKVVCIYRISHKLDYENENVYIGSTVDLHKRKICHKSTCITETNKSYHSKPYEYIRENGGFENFQFTILRVCNDADKTELFKLEQSFIDVYEPTLNTRSASQTKDEWREKNKEKIQNQKKVWQQEHKQEIKQKKEVYYQEHREEINKQRNQVIVCECGINSTRRNISTHRKTKHHQEYLKFNKEK